MLYLNVLFKNCNENLTLEIFEKAITRINQMFLNTLIIDKFPELKNRLVEYCNNKGNIYKAKFEDVCIYCCYFYLYCTNYIDDRYLDKNERKIGMINLSKYHFLKFLCDDTRVESLLLKLLFYKSGEVKNWSPDLTFEEAFARRRIEKDHTFCLKISEV